MWDPRLGKISQISKPLSPGETTLHSSSEIDFHSGYLVYQECLLLLPFKKILKLWMEDLTMGRLC
jgi:hypothetical protein